MVILTTEQRDRAAGVLLGAACGDALGVPYEFAARLHETAAPEMIGGGLGPYEPGEYSDDTQMQACVAEVAARGRGLRSELALDGVAIRFMRWYREGASDIGAQTRQVFAAVEKTGGTSSAMRKAAAALHARTGRSAGNGSLMRTVPVALAHLDDPDGLVHAARKVSALTHHDPMAGDACAVWCLMLRHTILEGDWPESSDGAERRWRSRGTRTQSFAERSPVPADDLPSSVDWRQILTEAEQRDASAFTENAWVVGAMQAAWSAITHTDVPDDDPQRHLQLALATAIGIGHDTDTVGAIAGGMLGARWGASAVPRAWVERLHGWRDQTGAGLAELARRVVTLAD